MNRLPRTSTLPSKGRRGLAARLALAAFVASSSMGAQTDLQSETATQDPVAAGDAAWETRAFGQVDGRPPRQPIADAIASYEGALATDPGNLEARWRLMRALFFLGEYVVESRDEKLALFERSRDLGEEGLAQLAQAVGGVKKLLDLPPDELVSAVDDRTLAAEVTFWTAVNWGVWGRTRGKLASAREGVAGKIRDYAGASVALDPTIENGGGHRVLGRLHTEAPKIPFITGWIDRDEAIHQLETCSKLSPADLTTRLYLGEALARFDSKRRAEGLDMLRELIVSPPNPAYLIEELKAIRDARDVLAELAG